jgi:hypothetical protein
MTGRWVVFDADASALAEVNPYTDDQWTAAGALKQQLYAEADGCTGSVLALLVVEVWDSAYFVAENVLHVVPLRADGWPVLDDAAAVDLDHARSAGSEIDWVIEQFAQ